MAPSSCRVRAAVPAEVGAILAAMTLPLGDVAWWAPIAIVGGALAGIVIAFLVLEVAGGRPGATRTGRRLAFERTDKTNYPVLNPAAFIVFFGAIGLIVGLAVGLSAG